MEIIMIQISRRNVNKKIHKLNKHDVEMKRAPYNYRVTKMNKK